MMPRAIRSCLGLALAVGALALLFSAPAQALSDPTGVWTLSDGTPNRICRLQLRSDAAATGQAVAIPPGCRHAFPVLATVRSWSIPDGIHLALNDEIGASVLLFGDTGDGHLQATDASGGAAYVLTAVGGRRVDTAAAAVAAKPKAETPVAPVRPAVSPAAVAGHYAVMRGSRDTGCMVTLDDPNRSAATSKARLAPACRDQGIIVFDPVGWSLKAGALVLHARKGHSADFSQDEAGIWVKDGKGQPLGLKRL